MHVSSMRWTLLGISRSRSWSGRFVLASPRLSSPRHWRFSARVSSVKGSRTINRLILCRSDSMKTVFTVFLSRVGDRLMRIALDLNPLVSPVIFYSCSKPCRRSNFNRRWRFQYVGKFKATDVLGTWAFRNAVGMQSERSAENFPSRIINILLG